MKAIRRCVTWAALFLLLSAISAMSARAQGPFFESVKGSFTLPFEVQWGVSTLPAGDYTFSSGHDITGWPVLVVRGTAKGSRYNLVQVRAHGQSKAHRSMLVCIRGAKSHVVRSLELPVSGLTLHFSVPKGEKILAQHQGHGPARQLAEVRVPITVAGK